MAEFPDAGAHCSMAQCNQLDFVPFCCTLCNAFYCKNHRLPDQHFCKFVADQEQNETVKSNDDDGETMQKFLCSMSGCFVRERTRIQCANCDCNFCMRHRICEDHACTGLRSNRVEPVKINLAIDQTHKNTPKFDTTDGDAVTMAKDKKKNLNASQQARLDRAQIMKLKVRNPLKIPTEQQFFLFAHFDGKRHPMLVDRDWSMLKVRWEIGKQIRIETSKIDQLHAFPSELSSGQLQQLLRKDDDDDAKTTEFGAIPAEVPIPLPLPLDQPVSKLLANETELWLVLVDVDKK